MSRIVGLRDFKNTTKNMGVIGDFLKRVNSRQLGPSALAHPIKLNHFITLYQIGLGCSL